ncbi:hypothetical protein Nans01_32460 [Nocardiopsis ansamitocini]|uniref:Uncharacterized protein n=1 Tax=Nocardiopsis ansamitocini TaxID=1670832 RepID=A0A9W6P7F6_9ACTN|nr:hypothetical protein Nans01_32460 [Nocardiopsis ansamitocini]
MNAPRANSTSTPPDPRTAGVLAPYTLVGPRAATAGAADGTGDAAVRLTVVLLGMGGGISRSGADVTVQAARPTNSTLGRPAPSTSPELLIAATVEGGGKAQGRPFARNRSRLSSVPCNTIGKQSVGRLRRYLPGYGPSTFVTRAPRL